MNFTFICNITVTTNQFIKHWQHKENKYFPSGDRYFEIAQQFTIIVINALNLFGLLGQLRAHARGHARSLARVHINTNTYTRTHAHTLTVFTHVRANTHTHTHTHTHRHAHALTHVRTHTHTRAPARARAHTHTHTLTHTHSLLRHQQLYPQKLGVVFVPSLTIR